MSSEKHFLETKEAIGTKVWCERSGIGEVIEMQAPYSYRMHNGIRWESDKIVDQYLDYGGVKGVRLKEIHLLEDAVRFLTANVQERDSTVRLLRQHLISSEASSKKQLEEIERLKGVVAQYESVINTKSDIMLKNETEIGRLRGEIEFARREFNGIGLQAYAVGVEKINRRATEAGDRMFTSLEGAE